MSNSVEAGYWRRPFDTRLVDRAQIPRNNIPIVHHPIMRQQVHEGRWVDEDEVSDSAVLGTDAEAVKAVAARAGAGLRFHDLRHSYATWLVDDGVPPNMVQRVMGHENVTTTLQLYTRRTEHHDRILDALGALPNPRGHDPQRPVR